jgi:anti-anti-sigma factor
MAGSTAKLMVAVEGSRAVIRPCGRASFTCSADFKRLVYELVDAGCRDFELELSECTIMDSTFLGILVYFARKLDEQNGGESKVVLVNASSRILDLVASLGMTEFFTVRENGGARASGASEVEVAVSEADKEACAEIALEAHQTLMSANPENVARFKDVARFLAEDLKKLRESRGEQGQGTAS